MRAISADVIEVLTRIRTAKLNYGSTDAAPVIRSRHDTTAIGILKQLQNDVGCIHSVLLAVSTGRHWRMDGNMQMSGRWARTQSHEASVTKTTHTSCIHAFSQVFVFEMRPTARQSTTAIMTKRTRPRKHTSRSRAWACYAGNSPWMLFQLNPCKRSRGLAGPWGW